MLKGIFQIECMWYQSDVHREIKISGSGWNEDKYTLYFSSTVIILKDHWLSKAKIVAMLFEIIAYA